MKEEKYSVIVCVAQEYCYGRILLLLEGDNGFDETLLMLTLKVEMANV